VTHREVDERDFHGGSRHAIKQVLRAFPHTATIDWMQRMGVALKLEDTGKYFPVTDQARTVLEALLRATREAGVTIRTGVRVVAITGPAPGDSAPNFMVETSAGTLSARCVVLATGGCSLPKSGSDGVGLQLARRLGHRLVEPVPALAPLTCGEPVARPTPDAPPWAALAAMQGLTVKIRLEVVHRSGRRVASAEGPLLFTHFGLSGPAALDISRHFLRLGADTPQTAPEHLITLAHPTFRDLTAADAWLMQHLKADATRPLAPVLNELWPRRYAEMLAREVTGTDAQAPPTMRLADLTRDQRRRLARWLSAMPLPVTGHRGWAFAETTAGGVALEEINPRTMESRLVPRLFFCGEMIDVDGRLGGFNFQWAWASGHVAGRHAVKRLRSPDAP
jgi:predicted Rossmann fold flavoprotein